MEINKKIFLYINQFAFKNIFLDNLMIFFAKITPYIFIIVLIYLYFYKKIKSNSIYTFYSVVLALFFNQIIALFYYHNRPFVNEVGTALIQHSIDSSFPSDHTTFLFAIFFSLIFFNIGNKLFKIIIFLLALIGSVARIYVGVHYPFDIIGGIFNALIASLVIYKIQNKLKFLNEIIFNIENRIFNARDN